MSFQVWPRFAYLNFNHQNKMDVELALYLSRAVSQHGIRFIVTINSITMQTFLEYSNLVQCGVQMSQPANLWRFIGKFILFCNKYRTYMCI